MIGFNVLKLSLVLAATTFLSVANLPNKVMAATVGFTNRADLAANDLVNWGSLGPSGTSVTNPFSINSLLGNTLTVSKTAGFFETRTEGSSWFGNFLPGDKLLWTKDSATPLRINFAQAVSRAGTNIMADYYGAFTATITAFDNLGNTLGSFTRAGNSSGARDGSAIFLGIGSDQANISRLEIFLPTASLSPGDFAINSVSLTTPVPEPLTILGTVTAAGMGVAMRRKQKQQQKATTKVG